MVKLNRAINKAICCALPQEVNRERREGAELEVTAKLDEGTYGNNPVVG